MRPPPRAPRPRGAARPSDPRVAAHRGAARLAPENTLAAFRAALELGARALELDVHLTRDERVVVLHDVTLDRTTDGSGPVHLRSAAEVRALDAGGWFATRFARERVPLLHEVLRLARGRPDLHLELKGPAGSVLAERAVAEVRQRRAENRTLFMSFDLDQALSAKRAAGASIPVLAIVAERLEDPLGFVRSTGLDGLNQAVGRWDAGLVARFHEHGLLVHGSLSNDPGAAAAFFAIGGDRLDSDEPACYLLPGAPG